MMVMVMMISQRQGQVKSLKPQVPLNFLIRRTIQNEEGEKDEAINLFDVALSIIGVTQNSFLGGMFILLVCDQHGPQPI